MKPKRFTVDAARCCRSSRSIKDHITAVIELVKNSYDANASVVVIDLAVSAGEPSVHSIRITDNGCGMDEDQIENNWLRIGFSEKLADRIVKGRRKLGEKGVGRLLRDRWAMSWSCAARRGKPLPLASRSIGTSLKRPALI